MAHPLALLVIPVGVALFGCAILWWKHITTYNRWVAARAMRRTRPLPGWSESLTRAFGAAFFVFAGCYVIVLGLIHL